MSEKDVQELLEELRKVYRRRRGHIESTTHMDAEI